MNKRKKQIVKTRKSLEWIKRNGIPLKWAHDDWPDEIGDISPPPSICDYKTLCAGPSKLGPKNTQGDVALWAIGKEVEHLDEKRFLLTHPEMEWNPKPNDPEQIVKTEKSLSDAKFMQREVQKEINRDTGMSAEEICRRAGCNEDTVRRAKYWGEAFETLVLGASEKAAECIELLNQEEYEEALRVAEEVSSKRVKGAWWRYQVWTEVIISLEELVDSVAAEKSLQPSP